MVETAGGLCSPLKVAQGKALTNLDLLRDLDPGVWVLVAADRLGVLHDVEVARLASGASYRRPDAIVLTEAAAPSQASHATKPRKRMRPGPGRSPVPAAPG